MRASLAFDLDGFVLLELSGADRLDWLQGQATNDVRGLVAGASAAFCFCEPTGQILAVLDAWAFSDRIVMTTERPRGGAVLDRVERMTILEDVAARELPFAGVYVSEAPAGDDLLVLPSNRAGAGGWDVWGAGAAFESLRTSLAMCDPEPSRIAAGVPKWGVDVGARTLPAEMGPAFEDRHVSYAKGCYTGQEVLMRMHARGHANRTWVGLVSAGPLAVGAPILFEGKEVGRVSSSAPYASEEGWAFVAAGTLRNEAAVEGTKVLVGETAAEVRTMPIVRSL